MQRRNVFYILLAACLLFPGEGCSKVKAPAEKKAEQTVVKPAVAGAFYPADKEILSTTIEKYLNEAAPAPVSEHIFGIAVPHAGYQYSGPVAAYAYKSIEGKKYSTVVVMAPSHRVGFEGIALTTKDFYETPLGRIPIAKELSQKLMSDFSWAKDDPRPYGIEHSLEVELPFLQTVLKDFKVLPIIVGVTNPNMLSKLAAKLNEMLPGGDVLFVASTDLSHYHPYNDAAARDKKTIKIIEDMNVAAFAAAELKGEAELCGGAPVETLMEIAKLRKGKAKLVKYANSGDVTGDKSRVVGYGAFVFTGGAAAEEGALSETQKKTLLAIARNSIEAEVSGKPQPKFDIKDPVLLKDGAAFVTIREHGDLRGCIGHIMAVGPLYKSVRDNAASAASQDPRFPPVRPDELKNIDLEISVLTPPEPLLKPMDVRIGTDGLIIQKGYNRGVLLPQVPGEQGWGKEEFLEGICRKAGMSAGCWKDANLMRFQAIVFHE